MVSQYKFTEKQIQELTKAAMANKDKNVDRRLRELMANGKKLAGDCIDNSVQLCYTVKLEDFTVICLSFTTI